MILYNTGYSRPTFYYHFENLQQLEEEAYRHLTPVEPYCEEGMEKAFKRGTVEAIYEAIIQEYKNHGGEFELIYGPQADITHLDERKNKITAYFLEIMLEQCPFADPQKMRLLLEYCGYGWHWTTSYWYNNLQHKMPFEISAQLTAEMVVGCLQNIKKILSREYADHTYH